MRRSDGGRSALLIGSGSFELIDEALETRTVAGVLTGPLVVTGLAVSLALSAI